MYAAPQSPQSIGGVLDTTVNLFKASFRYCWPAALLYSILNLVLTVWMQQRLLAAAAEPAASVTEVMALLASPAIWGGYLLMFIASVFINLVITTTILDVARNRPSGGALAQLGSTLPLLPGALGLFLVIMLGVMVGGIVLAIVAGMAGAGAGLVGGSPGAGGAAVIGFLFLLLLAVPCLYLVVRWSLWSAAYTDRRKGAFAAMGTSWNLVDGNWWRTLVIVSVVGIIIMVLVILLAVLTGYFAAVSGQDSFAQILVSAALQAVMQVLYLPALSACLVATYMDLQLRKGGADLEARLGSLGPQA